MNPFELGYKAFMDGFEQGDNPFDANTAIWSRREWSRGWMKSKREHVK